MSQVLLPSDPQSETWFPWKLVLYGLSKKACTRRQWSPCLPVLGQEPRVAALPQPSLPHPLPACTQQQPASQVRATLLIAIVLPVTALGANGKLST